MPVEIFTREQFEYALPMKGKFACWRGLGIVDGEYSYLIPCTNGNGVGIHIRSSIGPSGKSAECGENSIRAWIVDAEASRNGDHRPLGNKIQRWTTREKGWERRLWNPKAEKEKDKGLLWHLGKMASMIGPCPQCGTRTRVFRVRKAGPNKGRAFLKCPNEECGGQDGRAYFQWLDDKELEDSEVQAQPEPRQQQQQEKSYKLTALLNEEQLAGVKALLKAWEVTPTVEEVGGATTALEEEEPSRGYDPIQPKRPTPVQLVEVRPAPYEDDMPPECPDCGGKIMKFVSRRGKEENLGRQFITCQGKRGDGCGYFHWLDQPFTG